MVDSSVIVSKFLPLFLVLMPFVVCGLLSFVCGFLALEYSSRLFGFQSFRRKKAVSVLRRGMGLYGVRYYVGRVYLLSRILPIRALGMLRML